MSEQVSGYIDSVSEKAFNGKKLYNVKVNDTWYGVGDKQPPAKGAKVSFTADKRGNYWNVVGGITEVKVEQNNFGGTSPVRNREETKQRVIQYQAARNSALNAVEILVSAGAIKLPAKQADQVDVLLGLIDEITDRYDRDALDIGEFGERTGGAGADVQNVDQEEDE